MRFCRARSLAFGVPSGRLRLARDGDRRLLAAIPIASNSRSPIRFRRSRRPKPPARSRRAAACRARSKAGRCRRKVAIRSSRIRRPNTSRRSAAQPAMQPAAYRPQPAAGRAAPDGRQAQQSQKNWGWNGGTPITVAQGETIQSMSHRYGVPAHRDRRSQRHDDRHADLSRPAPGDPEIQLRPGRRGCRRPPRRSHAARAPARVAPAVTGSVRNAAQGGRCIPSVPARRCSASARRYHVSPVALAQANNLPPHHQLRMGERLTIPGAAGSRARAAAAAPGSGAAPARCAASAAAPATAPAQRVAEFQPAPPPAARVMTPAKEKPAGRGGQARARPKRPPTIRPASAGRRAAA